MTPSRPPDATVPGPGDYDYPCPPELIAQHPAARRADSRLLVLGRADGAIRHRAFADFPSLLAPGDVLVVNTSRVIPARLIGVRDNGRPAEVLLVHPDPDGTWLAMVHPGGKLKVGRKVRFGGATRASPKRAGGAVVPEGGTPSGPLLEIVEVVGGGLRRVRFHGMDARDAMQTFGAVPLPPYIHRAPDPEDRDRYQTVYARQDGSVAAPTAGLHFTPEILDAVRDRGVAVAEVVLHVGPGTFKPVETEDLREHVMHAEWYEITEEAATAINAARAGGGRVWAVGTTSVRVLESVAAAASATDGGRGDAGVARPTGVIRAGSGWTSIFIYPPYTFRAVDGLLTNFHLPRSTLLMLVAAFAGRDATLRAYAEAVRERYRLYSYGDAMAILPA